MVVPYVVVPFPVIPTGRQLTGAERVSTATAEETDIDAVEVPLPGNDILEFSRGVTDLDAVGKDGGSHIDSTVGDLHVWSGCLRASWVIVVALGPQLSHSSCCGSLRVRCSVTPWQCASIFITS